MLNHIALECGNLCVSVSPLWQWSVKAKSTLPTHLAGSRHLQTDIHKVYLE